MAIISKKTASPRHKASAEELQAKIDLAIQLAKDSSYYDFFDYSRYFIDQMTRVLAGKNYEHVVEHEVLEWLPGLKPRTYKLPRKKK